MCSTLACLGEPNKIYKFYRTKANKKFPGTEDLLDTEDSHWGNN